jgi:hypothetical protein
MRKSIAFFLFWLLGPAWVKSPENPKPQSLWVIFGQNTTTYSNQIL